MDTRDLLLQFAHQVGKTINLKPLAHENAQEKYLLGNLSINPPSPPQHTTQRPGGHKL